MHRTTSRRGVLGSSTRKFLIEQSEQKQSSEVTALLEYFSQVDMVACWYKFVDFDESAPKRVRRLKLRSIDQQRKRGMNS